MPGSRGYAGGAAAPNSIASPMLAKPPMMPGAGAKPKSSAAPPVATFQTKTFDYEQPKSSRGL